MKWLCWNCCTTIIAELNHQHHQQQQHSSTLPSQARSKQAGKHTIIMLGKRFHACTLYIATYIYIYHTHTHSHKTHGTYALCNAHCSWLLSTHTHTLWLVQIYFRYSHSLAHFAHFAHRLFVCLFVFSEICVAFSLCVCTTSELHL